MGVAGCPVLTFPKAPIVVNQTLDNTYLVSSIGYRNQREDQTAG